MGNCTQLFNLFLSFFSIFYLFNCFFFIIFVFYWFLYFIFIFCYLYCLDEMTDKRRSLGQFLKDGIRFNPSNVQHIGKASHFLFFTCVKSCKNKKISSRIIRKILKKKNKLKINFILHFFRFLFFFISGGLSTEAHRRRGLAFCPPARARLHGAQRSDAPDVDSARSQLWGILIFKVFLFFLQFVFILKDFLLYFFCCKFL
jgi:hypothetical protein